MSVSEMMNVPSQVETIYSAAVWSSYVLDYTEKYNGSGIIILRSSGDATADLIVSPWGRFPDLRMFFSTAILFLGRFLQTPKL